VGIDACRWGTVQAKRRIGTDGTAENVAGKRRRTALPYPGEEKLI
jgi:hypothetical protein